MPPFFFFFFSRFGVFFLAAATLPGGQLVETFWTTPPRRMTVAAGAFTFLLAFTTCCWRARSLRLDPAQFFSLFSPVVRGQLLLLYGFAVLHKLNFDFFDPAVSCAPEMLRETLALRLPSVTDCCTRSRSCS